MTRLTETQKLKQDIEDLKREGAAVSSAHALAVENIKAYQEHVKNLTALTERLWTQKAVVALKAIEMLAGGASLLSIDDSTGKVIGMIRRFSLAALNELPVTLELDKQAPR